MRLPPGRGGLLVIRGLILGMLCLGPSGPTSLSDASVGAELERASLITGVVIDDHAQPIEGVVVTALQPPCASGADFVHHREAARTDSAGRFHLTRPTEEDYLVLDLAPPEGFCLEPPVTVSTAQGVLRIHLQREVPVEVTVCDRSGAPVGKASVLQEASSWPLRYPWLRRTEVSVADELGRLTIRVDPRERYDVCVLGDAYPGPCVLDWLPTGRLLLQKGPE
jgi:hypothetical protein